MCYNSIVVQKHLYWFDLHLMVQLVGLKCCVATTCVRTPILMLWALIARYLTVRGARGAVWYSVDLPTGTVLPAPLGPSPRVDCATSKPQLYLLNVCPTAPTYPVPHTCTHPRTALVYSDGAEQHLFPPAVALATTFASCPGDCLCWNAEPGGATGLPKALCCRSQPLSCDGQDVSGAFRPNVLTALVGASGAGKVMSRLHLYFKMHLRTCRHASSRSGMSDANWAFVLEHMIARHEGVLVTPIRLVHQAPVARASGCGGTCIRLWWPVQLDPRSHASGLRISC